MPDIPIAMHSRYFSMIVLFVRYASSRIAQKTSFLSTREIYGKLDQRFLVALDIHPLNLSGYDDEM